MVNKFPFYHFLRISEITSRRRQGSKVMMQFHPHFYRINEQNPVPSCLLPSHLNISLWFYCYFQALHWAYIFYSKTEIFIQCPRLLWQKLISSSKAEENVRFGNKCWRPRPKHSLLLQAFELGVLDESSLESSVSEVSIIFSNESTAPASETVCKRLFSASSLRKGGI